MVSHHYRLPKQIFIDTELSPLPESLDNLSTYPFNVEREALSEMAAARKQQQEERERLQSEYVKRQKLAARRIAPGFLDTDTRILQPEPLYHRDEEGEEGELPSAPRHQQLDYQKFEQGLAPPDPWDQPENDLVALRSILGPADQGWANMKRQQQQQQHQHQPRPPQPQLLPQQPQPQSHPHPTQQQQQQQQQHTYPPTRPHVPAPALPPKPYASSPSSAQTSPRAASVTPVSDSPPPPVPPHPQHDDLIEELVNMGFSKPQAADALEKNDHDLTKATNFLLDHGIG
ncbi:hypothetical protein BDB00DRAFT_827587 [Zychaea mexicana]|uniref:uncharacterized protein n=1 Tax=Zychaea mexicana TaxID=64656 RepID=UPI0022FE5C5B|nr:uncharacterized protein BDB00DRAFT_827587 [Zychaea mexicana]KAI9492664.1 hypothetical protein BDB00DRAFT_827587 [Zychaea mexicana]